MIKNTHRKYILEEKRLPSVTEILAIVAKPYLIPWANRMGLQGVDLMEYNAEFTNLGTLVHGKIESYYNNTEFDDTAYPEAMKLKANELFGKFLNWESGRKIFPLFNELPMICHRFGGTIDAVVEMDGKLTIIDWKTSREIYPEYFAQLSAYFYLMRYGKPMIGEPDFHQRVIDTGKRIEQVAVVQIPKDGEPASRIIPVKSDEFRVAWEFFSASLNLYNAEKEISKLKR